MKGCLKLRCNATRRCDPRKCVAFCEEGSEEVHVADEWDRTPAPPRRLSYQDILELREIQRSLPIAEQIPDPLTKRPHPPKYLSNIPVALLPLLPDSALSPRLSRLSSPVSSPCISPPFIKSNFQLPPAPIKRLSHLYHPPSLAHLPTATSAPCKPRPAFRFLPLLDSPPSTPSSSYPSSASNSPPPIYARDVYGPQDDYGNALYTTTSADLDSPNPRPRTKTELLPGYAVPPSYFAIPPEPPSSGDSSEEEEEEEQYIIINSVKVPIRDL